MFDRNKEEILMGFAKYLPVPENVLKQLTIIDVEKMVAMELEGNTAKRREVAVKFLQLGRWLEELRHTPEGEK